MAYKRDGVWYYDFTLNKIRHNKSTQARNKRQAEDIERKVRNDMVLGIHGLVSPKDCPTVKAFFDGRFLDFVRVRSKKKPRTIAYYEEKVKRLLEFDIAGFQLFELDPDKIDQLKTACSAKQWNATTVNHVLKTLRHGLNMAEEWGLIRRAPKVRMLPGEVGRDYVLSYQTEALYFSKVREPLLTAAVLMVDTGLRPDECVSRPWTDVFLSPAPDAKYGYIRITDAEF